MQLHYTAPAPTYSHDVWLRILFREQKARLFLRWAQSYRKNGGRKCAAKLVSLEQRAWSFLTWTQSLRVNGAIPSAANAFHGAVPETPHNDVFQAANWPSRTLSGLQPTLPTRLVPESSFTSVPTNEVKSSRAVDRTISPYLANCWQIGGSVIGLEDDRSSASKIQPWASEVHHAPRRDFACPTDSQPLQSELINSNTSTTCGISVTCDFARTNSFQRGLPVIEPECNADKPRVAPSQTYMLQETLNLPAAIGLLPGDSGLSDRMLDVSDSLQAADNRSVTHASTDSATLEGSSAEAPERGSNARLGLPCSYCHKHPNGFYGNHELQRHINQFHTPRYKIWTCIDPGFETSGACRPVKPIQDCKKCERQRGYNSIRNAIRHLRCVHFNPVVTLDRGPRDRGEIREKQVTSGGDWPPHAWLMKYWLQEQEIDRASTTAV